MKNIAISGGGLNSIYFLGAIKYLDEKKLINDLENFSGTSAGSIICLILILGYRYNEFYKILKNYKMSNVLEMDIFNLTTNYGLYSNTKIKKIINIFIKNKLNIVNPTFKTLYNLTKKKLHIVATNVENGEETVFNVDNSPNVIICDAICASCALPFIFPYSEINGNKYIDGAFINTFPLNIFKDDLENTIGINMRSHILKKNKKVSDIAQYISNIYDLTLNSLGGNCTNKLLAKINIEICIKQNLNISTYFNNLDNIIDETYQDIIKQFENN